jgi:hypothetical protein
MFFQRSKRLSLLFISILFLPIAYTLVTSPSTEALRPRPPQQQPPQWFVRSVRTMRGGGDIAKKSSGVDPATGSYHPFGMLWLHCRDVTTSHDLGTHSDRKSQ